MSDIVDDLRDAREGDVAAQPLAEPQANQIRHLMRVVIDLAGELDRLQRLAVRGQQVEAQALPVDDRLNLAGHGLSDVLHRSGTTELAREGLDPFELLAPAPCFRKQAGVVEREPGLARDRAQTIQLLGRVLARLAGGERKQAPGLSAGADRHKHGGAEPKATYDVVPPCRAEGRLVDDQRAVSGHGLL